MGKKRNRLKGQAAKSNLLSGQADSVAVESGPTAFCVSLKHCDFTQGQRFEEWEKEALLAKLLNRWHSHCQKSLQECLDQRFKRYPSFPPTSKFKHPKHVTQDAQWASMHLQGRECIAGHIIGNVFYVVFLDRHHEFWPTDKKHT